MMTIAGSETGVTALCFDGQRHFSYHIPIEAEERRISLFDTAFCWLDRYFEGEVRPITFPLTPHGTDFRMSVWNILREIPSGNTATYGEIAAKLAARKGLGPMSPRAIGNAVGRNPISIMVPCHRVLGAGGKLTGYAGGLDRKRALLGIEGVCGLSL